jgi:hypothetical protein
MRAIVWLLAKHPMDGCRLVLVSSFDDVDHAVSVAKRLRDGLRIPAFISDANGVDILWDVFRAQARRKRDKKREHRR